MNAPHRESRSVRTARAIQAQKRDGGSRVPAGSRSGWAAAAAAGALLLIQADPAEAQARRQRQGQAPAVAAGTQFVPCPTPGQPLVRIPEIVSANGKLQGTILLASGPQRLYLGNADPTKCVPQFVRSFRALS